LTLSRNKIEYYNAFMQYFAIAMTALLVTTPSPKDCEDGYFTGYILSLSSFSISVLMSLFCYAFTQGYKLETFYYISYFVISVFINLLVVFLNFVFNSSDCGIYSVRGFAAACVSICSGFVLILIVITNAIISLWKSLNNWLDREYQWKITDYEE
jgi:hypothetical protein